MADLARLAFCQATCPRPGFDRCPLPGCPWRCEGCASARPKDANGYHLTKQFLFKVLCNRVKYLGLAGWVREGFVGWQNDAREYVEWVNALGERIDWREGYPPFRQCNSTSAVPQWLLKSQVDWVNTAWAVVPWSQAWWFRWIASQVSPVSQTPVVPLQRPGWQTTEGSGGLDGTIKPYRKPPQASQSRGGRRYA